MQFYQLAIGAKFFAHRKRWTKEAISMASGHVMMAETEVIPDGEPLLLPPEEAAKWKPDEGDWTRFMARAPSYVPEGIEQP